MKEHNYFTEARVKILNQQMYVAMPLTVISLTLMCVLTTSHASITFTLPDEIPPEEWFNIFPKVNNISIDQNTYLTILESNSEDPISASRYISNGYLQINGTPGTEFNLTIQTVDGKYNSSTQLGKLGNCRLGLNSNNGTCVCSDDVKEKKLAGIGCSLFGPYAYRVSGYWVGCTDNKLLSGFCPKGYCNFELLSNSLYQGIPRTCQALQNDSLCAPHRTGQLCGECSEGYTTFYHTENYVCKECTYGRLGLLIYLVGEVIPLILFLVVIFLVKLKLTSGLMQSLLLFVQTVTIIDHINIPSAVESRSLQIPRSIYMHVISFLSMHFIWPDKVSFCLWNGATVLDNLVFHYVTTLFSILFIALVVLNYRYSQTKLVNLSFVCHGRARSWLKTLVNLVCHGRIMTWLKKHTVPKTTLVHSISTFLILFYTQCTVTSFQILSHLSVSREEKDTLSVVRWKGNVVLFHKDHLPYAIPAVLMILCFSIPPPLLLIAYPLLWNIKAKLRRTAVMDNDKTAWPIRKFLPLIDSFQGIFRDKCRMFAGLLFLWRLILASIFAFTSVNTIALFFFLSVHAVTRPYKESLYNKIDLLMLANLCIINALSWYIIAEAHNVLISEADRGRVTSSASSFKLFLLYLPLIYLLGIMIIRILKKCGITKEHIPCMSYVDPTAPEPDADNSTSKAEQKWRVSSYIDDFFKRAAEPNITPLRHTQSVVEIELHAQDTAHETMNTQ